MAEIKQSNVSHTHTRRPRGFDGISRPRLTSQYSLRIAPNVCHSPEEFTQEQRLLRIHGERAGEGGVFRQRETMHVKGGRHSCSAEIFIETSRSDETVWEPKGKLLLI